MTVDRNYDEGGVPVRRESTEPSGGIYSLPAVGNAFSVARRFYDEMAPRKPIRQACGLAKRSCAGSRWPVVRL